jgi:hypothetical protein
MAGNYFRELVHELRHGRNKMITIAYLIAGKLPLPTVTNPAAV